MIVRVNGKIVDFIQDENRGWNTIEVPNLDIPQFTLKEIIEQSPEIREYLDLSSLDGYIQTSIKGADAINYHFMSKLEVTEFMYRFSKWSAGEFLAALNII